jgi:hypothetical protein
MVSFSARVDALQSVIHCVEVLREMPKSRETMTTLKTCAATSASMRPLKWYSWD